MIKKQDYFLHRSEWEDISLLSEISDLTFQKGMSFYPSNSVISINRAYDSSLRGNISGNNIRISDIRSSGDIAPGEVVDRELITGFTSDKQYKVFLYDCFLYDSIISYDSKDSRLCKEFKTEMRVGCIVIRKNDLPDNYPYDFVREWYISGQMNLYMPLGTTRSDFNGGIKARQFIDPDIPLDKCHIRSSGRDWMKVRLPEYSFIIANVPQGYCHEPCKGLVFEYRSDLGNIPDFKDMDKISQISGFVLGSQLSKLGMSFYDKNENYLGGSFTNPWGQNIPGRYERNTIPPITLADYYNQHKTEQILSKIIPVYLEKEYAYCLSGVLHKYWTARYSLIGANLPILSSAVESIAQRIFEINELPKSYFEKNEFKKLIGPELEEIKAKLSGHTYSEMIQNKIRSINQMGIGEKIRIMYELIGLKVGKIEKDAVRSRNIMAHTTNSGEIPKEERHQLLHQTHAYEILTNRIILKILGYQGDYLDYYTVNFPSRDIDEPIPE